MLTTMLFVLLAGDRRMALFAVAVPKLVAVPAVTSLYLEIVAVQGKPLFEVVSSVSAELWKSPKVLFGLAGLAILAVVTFGKADLWCLIVAASLFVPYDLFYLGVLEAKREALP